MRFDSTRFGTVELDESALIHLPQGMVGFPRETSYVLIRHNSSSAVGWLQSTTTPSLAFPVVSLDVLDVEYPEEPIKQAASHAGIGNNDSVLAVMAVVSAPGAGVPATVNLLSPVIVNTDTRTGAQLLLEQSSFSTHEPFVMRQKPGATSNAPAAEAPNAP